jgi:hypothetical protein
VKGEVNLTYLPLYKIKLLLKMKTTMLISAFLFTANFAFAQVTSTINDTNTLANNLMKIEEGNLKRMVSSTILEKKESNPKSNSIKLNTKNGVFYLSKFNEFQFETYLSPVVKNEPVLDEELDIRIKGKTDYSTRKND